METGNLHFPFCQNFSAFGIGEKGENGAFAIDDADIVIGRILINQSEINFSRKSFGIGHGFKFFAFRRLNLFYDLLRGKHIIRANRGCGHFERSFFDCNVERNRGCRGDVQRTGVKIFQFDVVERHISSVFLAVVSKGNLAGLGNDGAGEIDFRARRNRVLYAVGRIGGFFFRRIDSEREIFLFRKENVAPELGDVIEIIDGFTAGSERNQKDGREYERAGASESENLMRPNTDGRSIGGGNEILFL